MPGDFVKAGPQRSILDVYQPDGPLQFKLPGDVHNRLEIHWDGTIYAGDGTMPPSLITTGSVDSVNGQQGDVQLDAEDIPVTPAGTIAATDVQTALQELDTEKQALSDKNQANGYAGLDSNGLLSTNQLPALAVTSVFTVADQAAMLALDAQKGDIAIRSDESKSYALATNSPSTLADWKQLLTPTDTVLSVNSQTGAVQLDADDIPVDDSGFSNFEGTDVQAALADIDANWPTGGSSTDGLLAVTTYNPQPTATNYSTTSATLADIDATNLSVTFTAPASGSVLVELSAYANLGSNTLLQWGLRTPGGTDVAVTGAAATNTQSRVVATLYVTGLTPGASITWRWSHARAIGSATAGTRVGGDEGAAIMSVWAASVQDTTVLPGTIIARTAYSPSSQSTLVTTSSTFADVDATNLAITFTVPASGNIRFQVEGHWAIGVSTSLAFGIREGTTDVATRMFGSVGLDGSIDLVSTAFIDVEGLTPGASHTYKLSYARKGGSGTAGWRVGGTSDSKAGALTLSIIAL